MLRPVTQSVARGSWLVARFSWLPAFLMALTMPMRADQQPPSPSAPVFRSGLDLVVINVVVRDRNGQLVRDLAKDDFTLLEDNRPQTIGTFDFEQVDAPVAVEAPLTPLVLRRVDEKTPEPAAAPAAVDLSGRRLMLFFFDLTSMQPEDVERAIRSATEYVDGRQSPADVIGIASLGTSLRIEQDFTSDREALRAALNRLSATEGSGFEESGTTDPELAPDTGNAFLPDDTEFSIFNADRRIDALRSVTDAVAGIEQKKSVIYFSSGMSQSGLENRAALAALVDRAVRANLSIYTVDTRGLQATVPGGEAQSASVRGTGAFSGRAMDDARDQLDASQDTLVELAENTGGRAFLDSNEFGGVYTQVVHDTTAYYLLGFSSTNTARDGRYRRIKVTLRRPDVTLEYRSGYYAPRDFAHSSRNDRSRQLEDQLLSELPPTDLPVHGQAGFFRLSSKRYHVPLWLIVPGSFVPFTRANDTARATLDVLGVIRDPQQRPVAWIRDTVRLAVGAGQDVERRNVQYNTSLELPPGRYTLRVVLRENQNGGVGSLDTALVVPDLAGVTPKVSSIVLGSLKPVARRDRKTTNPLVREGRELAPNVTHIVSSGQPLDVYFEVYDAARPAEGARATAAKSRGVRVLSSLACFRGPRRVYQTDITSSQEVSAPDRDAVTVRLAVPPNALAPGFYTCQVNVVDDIAGTFAFPRVPLYVAR
jgi:VWFA-related protein